MRARHPRRRGLVSFAVLTVLADVAGHGLTRKVDHALHVSPLAPTAADYYPFLLVAVKIVGALALAALLARLLRAWARADAGHRLLLSLGQRQTRRAPKPRASVSLRVWAAAFASSSLAFLVQADAEHAVHGASWPLLAPWLHTYALPVLALLAVVVALVWSLTRWVDAVEDYAVRTLERVRRILSGTVGAPVQRARAGDDRGPRRRFGLAFESRPPPLAA